MHKDRMEHWIKIMQWVQDNHKKLNMEIWGYANEDPMDCGTVACAAGWAAHNKSFQERGLYLEGNRIVFRDGGDPEYSVGSLSAISAFFGISYAAARYIAYPACYPYRRGKKISPKQVIAHIRAVIASNGTDPRSSL